LLGLLLSRNELKIVAEARVRAGTHEMVNHNRPSPGFFASVHSKWVRKAVFASVDSTEVRR
jgi:hypothetical protein